jgi:hypothetical protein
MNYIDRLFASFLVVTTDYSLVIRKVHLYIRLLSIVLIGARKLIINGLPAGRRVSLTCQSVHLIQNHLEKHFIFFNTRIELSIPCFYFLYSILVLQIFGIKIDLSVFRVTIDGFSKEIRNFTALYSY